MLILNKYWSYRDREGQNQIEIIEDCVHIEKVFKSWSEELAKIEEDRLENLKEELEEIDKFRDLV